MYHRIRPLLTALAITATVAGGGAAIASAATTSSAASTTSSAPASTTTSSSTGAQKGTTAPMGAHAHGSSKNCPNM